MLLCLEGNWRPIVCDELISNYPVAIKQQQQHQRHSKQQQQHQRHRKQQREEEKQTSLGWLMLMFRDVFKLTDTGRGFGKFNSFVVVVAAAVAA